MINSKYILKSTPRLYKINRPIVAITGGIATGKSLISKYIQEKQLPFISADAQVKLIYQQDTTLSILEKLSPDVFKDNKVNFKKLRSTYFNDSRLRAALDAHIYPTLAQMVLDFSNNLPPGQELYYEVPLLFEKKLHRLVDVIILVYAPVELQRQRIFQRDGSSDLVIDKVLGNQLHIDDKKSLSHFIIDNSQSSIDSSFLKNQLLEILNTIRK